MNDNKNYEQLLAGVSLQEIVEQYERLDKALWDLLITIELMFRKGVFDHNETAKNSIKQKIKSIGEDFYA